MLPRLPRLEKFKLPGSLRNEGIFLVRYTPLFAPSTQDYASLYPSQQLILTTLDKYQRLPKDGLRWEVVANTAIKYLPKTVMRERARRRIREALRMAFNANGYEWDGRVLPQKPKQGAGGEVDSRPRPQKPLRGTLEFLLSNRKALDLEFTELIEFSGRAVRALVEHMHKTEELIPKTKPYEWWNPHLIWPETETNTGGVKQAIAYEFPQPQ